MGGYENTGSERFGIGLSDAIVHMVSICQKSLAEVSREIGRTRTYLSVMLHNSTTPRVDLLAKIAAACEYDLVLIGRGEALKVTAEQCGDSPVTVRRVWHVTEHLDGSLMLRINKDEVDWWDIGADYDEEQFRAQLAAQREQDAQRRAAQE